MSAANSTEFDPITPYPVIALVSEWTNAAGEIEVRNEHSDKGGTMWLGGQLCKLLSGSLAEKLYGKNEIVERHRHRYEVNNHLLPLIEKAGMTISGRSTLSCKGSTTSPPSIRGIMVIPLVVPQSSSGTTRSCATSTKRRVR